MIWHISLSPIEFSEKKGPLLAPPDFHTFLQPCNSHHCSAQCVGLELRPPGLVDFTLGARVDPSNERRTLGRITDTVNGDMRGIWDSRLKCSQRRIS